MDKAVLKLKLEHMASTKLDRLGALVACDRFVEKATCEAAYDPLSFAFFGHLRTAADFIPREFEEIDANPSVNVQDRRVQPYIRSQLFVALVAELEDYVFSVLRLVLRVHPKKIGDQQITIKELVDLGQERVVMQTINAKLNAISYEKPVDYKKTVIKFLSMEETLLDPFWGAFVEMKARRDVGVHGDWKRNEIYDRKVREGDGVAATDQFLGVGDQYFKDAVAVGERLILAFRDHTVANFCGV